MLWSGAIVDIPDGWILCNGAGGSPDLRDRFIVGAGSTYNPDATGGNPAHTHAFSADPHNHVLDAGAGIQAGALQGQTTSSNVATGVTDVTTVRPPWYALAFIFKT